MNNLKFRAWDKNHNTLIYVGDNKFAKTMGDLINNYEDEDLMQSTGLHDKNGKEIYKGDILSGVDENGETANVVVTWFQDNLEYIFVDTLEYPNFEPNYIAVDEPCVYREVVGNIFENPNLLKHA